MEAAYLIEKLINYSIKNNLCNEADYFFVRNMLFELYKVTEPVDFPPQFDEKTDTIENILEKLAKYAIEKGIIEDTQFQKEQLAAKTMGMVLPRPSEIIRIFEELKNKDLIAATDWYYNLSQKSYYIQVDKIKKNKHWKSTTKYGELEITINLSKPEKDPKDIAAARNQKSSTYPKCILCAENEGFWGNYQLPPRHNHRIIPLNLVGEKWFLQYSPYVYFNEHCILLSLEHRPMKIDKKTFERLLRFVEQFPHYFMGSNADLPIVGGSILSHDHFQGGRYIFPMNNAKTIENFKISEDLKLSILYWPLSSVRLQSKNIELLVNLADWFLLNWKNYSNPNLEIYSHSNNTPHNTITPIARFNGFEYELDLVFRNNRTSEQYPDGIFHPHPHLHNIKKENIGLIEVQGLAILPGRLDEELKIIAEHLFENISSDELAENFSCLKIHKHWIDELRTKIKPTDNIEQAIKNEVTQKFAEVLENCGVFPVNDNFALNEFINFVKTVLKTFKN